MLAIIVLGMGIDYAIYLVRSYQRYGNAAHPEFRRIRLAVTLAAFSTLIGFGVMCFADHALLQSAGVSSFLGICFCLVGAFVLLPPLLKHHFSRRTAPDPTDGFEKSVSSRYRHLEAYPRFFARFKAKFDPMFSELPRMLESCRDLGTVLDIGCGYGVPGCWLLDRYQNVRIHAIEPDPERVRVAGRVFGNRGQVTIGAAPKIPMAPEKADAAFLLDISHFLDDKALSLTLTGLRQAMHRGGHLVIRAVVPPEDGRVSRAWKIDAIKMKLAGLRAHHRPADKLAEIMTGAGFVMKKTELSGGNRESVWLVARANETDDTALSGI
jgi:SAM-dependent methyltransferase